MKIKWLIIPLMLMLVIITGCEDNDDEFNPETMHTGNMTVSAQLLSFESGDYISTWDIAMVYENSSYLVKLNSAANIVAVMVDTSFEASELPVVGFTSDTDANLVIGSDWQDLSTYNFMDNHSILSNGNTYYLLSCIFRFILV